MRQLRARAQNPYSPSPPNRPQSVSQSLSPVPHLRLSRVLPSHVLARIPCPLVLAPPSTFSFGDINPSPSPPRALCSLTLLFPPPHSHGNFFLFYAALYRCSCLLTHSLLQFFRRSLRSSRGVSPSSLFFLSFVRGQTIVLPSVLRISLYPTYPTLHPPFPRHRVGRPVYLSSIPHHDRAHHLHHISNLAHILSAAVSQTLKSFLGN